MEVAFGVFCLVKPLCWKFKFLWDHPVLEIAFINTYLLRMNSVLWENFGLRNRFLCVIPGFILNFG